MKKKLLLCVLIICSCSLWAAGKTERMPMHLDFGASYNYLFEAEDYSGADLCSHISTIGVNLGTFQPFANGSNWNSCFDLSFRFPLSYVLTLNGAKGTVPIKDFAHFYGYTFDFAPTYSFVRNEKMNISAGPSIRMSGMFMQATPSDYANIFLYFGLGTKLNAVFYLNNFCYFKTGLTASFNPLLYNGSNINYVTNIQVEPKLSFGFTY